jgi:hypothetical protein
MKNLLQLRPATELRLVMETDHWLAVANEIRLGRCLVKNLHLRLLQSSSLETTEAVKALASAIRLDRNLECLHLQLDDGFTDEAAVALAEVLTVYKTLSKLTVSVGSFCLQASNIATCGTPGYDAFSALLRVSTSLVLELPPFNDAVGDERLVDSRNQMRIEQSLNAVGRGRLLSSSQTPRKEWVDALDALNSSHIDETPDFNVSCLYSLLRLHPAVCMS